MKATHERIVTDSDNPLMVAYQLTVPSFPFFWHYHPEYELTQIISGSGTRMVGDSFESFRSGDLVLLGPNLPHTWVSQKAAGKKKSSAVVVQFSESMFLGISNLEAFEKIKLLLKRSRTGLSFRRSQLLDVLIQNLAKAKGVRRISSLLAVLDELSQCKAKRLASAQFELSIRKENEKRINKVCAFVQNHFSRQVSVKEMAALIHLSPSAFCKFFKKVTGKTFSDYLNEIRIGNACILLIESDKPVSAIAIECGFENLSYFNRVFLKKKKLQPKHFRHVNGT